MKLTCPVCRADNSAPSVCRRCKADLALLWNVERQRAAHLTATRAALARADVDDALDELEQAAALRHGDDIARFRACVFLVARDFATATARVVTTEE